MATKKAKKPSVSQDLSAEQVTAAIRDKAIELKKSTETKPLEFSCIHCHHEYEQQFNINVSDFFG